MPNCKDTKGKHDFPGPGHYDKKEDQSTLVSSADNTKRPETSYISGSTGEEKGAFLTKTKRVDHWRNDVSHPYTK